MAESIPINIWINEERLAQLKDVGLAESCDDVLAGMKVLKLQCTDKQKDELLKRYPTAKYDSATTRSIELLPADVKNKLFDLVIKNKQLGIIEKFLVG